MADRFRLRPSSEPMLTRSTLSAHVQASLYDALHDNALSHAEKVSAMRAIAALARDLNDQWRRSRPVYGLGSARLWFRLCGLSPEGNLSPEMLRRVAEVTSSVGERHIERGEN